MKTMKIFIADDHQVVRKGMKTIFSDIAGYTVVGEAENGLQVLEKIEALRPDIIIIDITMPGLDGIRVTSSLVEKYPDIKVVIFSMHHNKHYALEAFKAGASGFVLKGSDSRQLVDAVEKVAAGGKYASPVLADELFGDFVESIKKEKGTEPFDALSSREREILTLLAEGLTNREISKKLFIAESTVKTHRVNIMEKLRVNDITGLVRIAVNKGLVSTD